MFIIPNGSKWYLQKMMNVQKELPFPVYERGYNKTSYQTSIQRWESTLSPQEVFRTKRRWNGTPTTSKDSRKKTLSKKDTLAKKIANKQFSHLKKLIYIVREKPKSHQIRSIPEKNNSSFEWTEKYMVDQINWIILNMMNHYLSLYLS